MEKVTAFDWYNTLSEHNNLGLNKKVQNKYKDKSAESVSEDLACLSVEEFEAQVVKYVQEHPIKVRIQRGMTSPEEDVTFIPEFRDIFKDEQAFNGVVSNYVKTDRIAFDYPKLRWEIHGDDGINVYIDKENNWFDLERTPAKGFRCFMDKNILSLSKFIEVYSKRYKVENISEGQTNLGLNSKVKKKFNDVDAVDNVAYIKFEDQEVERICHEHGVYTYDDAAKVDSIKRWFNKSIETFNELKFFKGLKQIETGAFLFCLNLSEITLPDNITSIEDRSFSYCRALKAIKIPDKVTSIGNSAFWDCESLQEVKIPNNVYRIGPCAFEYCKSLKSINIPDKVIRLKEQIISNCPKLETIYISSGHPLRSFFYGYGTTKLVDPSEVNESISLGLNKRVQGRYSSNDVKTIAEEITRPLETPEEAVNAISLNIIDLIPDGWYVWTDEGDDYLQVISPSYDGKLQPYDGKLQHDPLGVITFDYLELPKISLMVEDEKISYVLSDDKYKNRDVLDNLTRAVKEYVDDFIDRGKHPMFDSFLMSNRKYFTLVNDSNRAKLKRKFISIDESNLGLNGKVKKKFSDVDAVDNVAQIPFEDKEVERICHEHDVYTVSDARQVSSIKGWFTDNGIIKSFNEFKYFTGLKEIEDHAFYNCAALQSISIPDSVTSIEINSFCFCDALQSINIPNGVTIIEDNAFYRCSSLQSIHIPDGVTYIEYSSFYKCTSLQSINIPDSVTSIGDSAFHGCSSLQTISISKNCPVYNKVRKAYPDIQLIEPKVNESSSLGLNSKVKKKFNDADAVNNVSLIPFEDSEVERICHEHGVYTVDDAARVSSIKGWFSYNEKIHSLVEFKYFTGLKEIERYAFYECRSLQSINIPDGVTSIGADAFFDCTSLQSINIPNGVTSIGSNAFSYCESIQSITIPNNVSSIGICVFGGCLSLQAIYISKNCPLYNQIRKAYPDIQLIKPKVNESSSLGLNSKVKKKFSDVDAVDNVAYIKFEDPEVERICHGYDVYTVDDAARVTSIKFWFSLNDNIKSFNEFKYFIGLKEIEDSAFQHCTSLQSITIPDSVTSIERYSFYRCQPLQSITIPDNVTSIEEYAFAGCKDLQSINIPDSVISIGNGAFNNCVNLQSITIPDSVTSIGSYTFYHCASLQSITIPDSVTSIGERVFACCENIQSITIPDGVTNIGDAAFASCVSLQSINIPDSVTYIAYSSFYNCSSLHTIYISKNCRVYDKVKNEYPNIQLIEPKVNESSSLGLNSKVKKKFDKVDAIDNINDYIDLGLPSGTLWCKHNYDEQGGYFNWNEVRDLNCDVIINHVPEASHFKELYRYCKVESTKIGDTHGKLLTSKINGKSIFFPALGYYWTGEDPNTIRSFNENGYYWSSTYSTAMCFFGHAFNPDGKRDKNLKFCVRTISKKTNESNLGLNKKVQKKFDKVDAVENVFSDYVDLGLPSGTLWKAYNEGQEDLDEYLGHEYTYSEALKHYKKEDLPTKDQFSELLNYCDLFIDNVNGKRTVRFKSSINQNTLYFQLPQIGIDHYWSSSTPPDSSNTLAYALQVSPFYNVETGINSYLKTNTFSIRTVINRKKNISESDLGLNSKVKKKFDKIDAIDNISEYVDLGLPSGNLWCTHNYEAREKTEYGGYFTYDEMADHNLQKITPTKDDWTELRDNCDLHFASYGDVRGIEAVSRTDSTKRVFFPSGGEEHTNGDTRFVGVQGEYLINDSRGWVVGLTTLVNDKIDFRICVVNDVELYLVRFSVRTIKKLKKTNESIGLGLNKILSTG